MKLPMLHPSNPQRQSKLIRLAVATAICALPKSGLAESPSVRAIRMPVVEKSTTESSLATPPTVTTVATTRPPAATNTAATRQWLPSTSAKASFAKSRQTISRARFEFDAKAWVSAENSAWEAIRHAAHGIDQNRMAHAKVPSIQQFENARAALIEARDFTAFRGPFTSNVAKRLTQSHQNKLLMDEQLQHITAIEASACYLNFARVQFAELAAQSVEAAEAMDLLAAIYLGRNVNRMMPSETALCLRRAALQGQPQNADLASRLGIHLADVGLLDEARWALEHSLAIQFHPQPASALVSVLNQTGDHVNANLVAAEIRNRSEARPNAAQRAPQITQVSPEQFASLSRPVQESVTPRAVPSAQQSAQQTMKQQTMQHQPMPQTTQRSRSSGIPASFVSARLNTKTTPLPPASIAEPNQTFQQDASQAEGDFLVGAYPAGGNAIVDGNTTGPMPNTNPATASNPARSLHPGIHPSPPETKAKWYQRLPKFW